MLAVSWSALVSPQSRGPISGAAGYGRDDFAFRIPIQDLGAIPTLHVLCDGEELPGSPVISGPGQFDGFVSRISGGYITGWVAERVANFSPPLIDVVDQNDEKLITGNSYFDSKSGDPFFVPARFRFPLPPSCFTGRELRLRVLANGVQFAPAVSCALRLTGFLDALQPDRCAGWLLSADAPDRHFELQVWRDGELVGTGKCIHLRDDLRKGHPQSYNTGFEIPLTPPDRKENQLSTLSIRLAGTGIELFEGPFVVGTRAATVASAQRAARSIPNGGSTTIVEQAVLELALLDFLKSTRRGQDGYSRFKQARRQLPHVSNRRLNIIIPIYADVKITRDCIERVLRERDQAHDAVILVNDCSPDKDMPGMLAIYAHLPGVAVLTNDTNIGFVKSVNRGLRFCSDGDVVLLNSDVRMFTGALDELWRIGRNAPDVATVTAMSNNATIFSYPHSRCPAAELDDVTWPELADVAIRENAGLLVEVPTGHGCCMLIRREVLDQLGNFNEEFGRGYGEENEFCLRAADLGYRHVAGAAVFVEHCESVSFGGEKNVLLKANLPKLEAMYPEYPKMIRDYELRDDLQRARLALDTHRLRKASENGARFALVVEGWLGGGSGKAAAEMESAVGYGVATKLTLRCTQDGRIELESRIPQLLATFASDDVASLFDLLSAAQVDLVLIHQLLGFSAEFIARLADFVTGRRSIYYVHDFFAICPRVTLIDANDEFCGGAETARCVRCVTIGGVHEASAMAAIDLLQHRQLFADLLRNVTYVIAPSESASRQLSALVPGLHIEIIPHPHIGAAFPTLPREGDSNSIVVLGAIGPHKGSRQLLEIAKRARLAYPDLQFHVVGYTDIDRELSVLGNVTLTGPYDHADLPQLIAKTSARVALFLHGWPETFSYTLTEAVENGLIPVVPDIGAPAERVRAAGFGVVFPFPINPAEVLDILANVAAGLIATDGTPAGFALSGVEERIRELLHVVETESHQNETQTIYSSEKRKRAG
jgi:GT2 family glycosyltransferase